MTKRNRSLGRGLGELAQKGTNMQELVDSLIKKEEVVVENNNSKEDTKMSEMVKQDLVEELAVNMGDSLQDVEDLREVMCEQVETPEFDIKEKVNCGLRNVLKVTPPTDKKPTNKQLYALNQAYKEVTGDFMTNEQRRFVAKLSRNQITRMITTVEYAKKNFMAMA